MKKIRCKKGFTLIELLTVVLIIGVLTGIALPNYTRSIERSRATEAMALIKTINDAVYAFAAQRDRCPAKFSELVVEIPGTKASDAKITSKNFSYEINAARNIVPGTSCKGALASRINGGDYNYKIWNPFTVGGGAGSHSLACYATTAKSIAICKSLDIYTTTAP